VDNEGSDQGQENDEEENGQEENVQVQVQASSDEEEFARPAKKSR